MRVERPGHDPLGGGSQEQLHAPNTGGDRDVDRVGLPGIGQEENRILAQELALLKKERQYYEQKYHASEQSIRELRHAHSQEKKQLSQALTNQGVTYSKILRNKERAHDELVREWRRVEREKCGRYNGRPKVAMRNRDTGEQVHVFEESADDVARERGLTPLSSGWKGSRIVTGPDRMLWKWAGDTLRWWPTGRTCLGTPLGGGDPTAMSPQRDPDGRTWLTNAEGEWVRLELFVEG